MKIKRNIIIIIIVAVLIAAAAILFYSQSRGGKSSGTYKDDYKTVEVSDDVGAKVSKAIFDNYSGNFLDGECEAEGHVIMEIADTGSKTVVYALVEYAEFGFENGIFTDISGANNPAVITIDNSTGECEFREPRDGSFYSEDINEMFPESCRAKILNAEGYRTELWDQMEVYARKYLESIGRDAEIRTYARVEHYHLSEYGISEKVMNAVDEKCAYFPDEEGNREKIEDGVRYVYSTAYDQESGLIKYTKYEYDTEKTVLYIEVNGQTGEIVTCNE